MKRPLILGVVWGILLGAGSTYLVMRDRAAPTRAQEDRSELRQGDRDDTAGAEFDPFESASPANDPDPFENWNPTDHPKLDMKDPAERDLCISDWYAAMDTVVRTLEFHTGHKFTLVAKQHATPQEILDEQIKFMREFEAETDRIAKHKQSPHEGPEK